MSSPSTQVGKMAQARDKATFDSVKMAEVIYGSKEAVSAQIAAYTRISLSPRLKNSDNMILPSIYSNTSREDAFKLGLQAGIATFEDDTENKSDVFRVTAYNGSFANANPLGLTRLLFTPSLKLLGTDEQIEKWGELAERGEIIGCYSQTELGHGSFVGGIETTATFDPSTDEFVVNSPSLSSTKYWPGALGYIATHSITMARLIIDKKDHGIHAFVMQIRSLPDGKPMLGCELGDIGMKMSYNGTDNGYAIFRHVRIPRTNMLMRHSTVLRDGTYTSIPLRQKLLFGGMLTGRLHIVRSAASQFAQALTICARYSVVRTQGRQFASSPSTSTSSCHVEQSIISYQHQKHRLLTLISRCYITVFAHHHASSLFAFLAAQQTRNDHTMLPFLHVLLCGLKAWSTDTAANGAEDARKMCGGHGCMAMSGMPDIVDRLTTMCTFEGENFVMWAQVARYLMKALDTPEFPEEMSYMSSSSSFPTTCSAAGEDISKHDVLMEIFQHRATRLAREAHELVQEAQRRSKSRAEAENIHSLPLLVAARAHIEVLVLSFSIEAFSHFLSSAPQSLVAVISRLISLFGLTTIASPLAPFTGSFLGDDYLSSSQLADMQAQIDALLEKLGPDVIALTDAWMFTDASLASAIGCADGDIYARMMAWTRQLPINVDAARNGGIWEEGKGELSSFWGRNMKRASKL